MTQTLAVDYYPEHWHPDRWPTDVALMQKAGITAIRIAEFAWSRIEPQEEQYEFEWLERVIRLAADRGIATVMCTPTAAPPAWLVRRHPDILPVLPDGRRMSFGSRRHYDPCSSEYRKHCRRITRVMAERFRDEPLISDN